MSARSFPWFATICMCIGVLILCALGTWQLKRLAWKEHLLLDLQHAYAQLERGDVGSLSGDILWQSDEKQGESLFKASFVRGEFIADKAFLLGPRVYEKRAGVKAVGAHVIVPLRAAEGRGIVLVNLGWSDALLSNIQDYLLRHYAGSLELGGIVRRPYWGHFTPENIPEQGAWYRADMQQIAQYFSLDEQAAFVSPYLFYVYSGLSEGKDFFARHEPWQPRNNHLNYALFWFSMAVILVVIYALRFFIFVRRDRG